MKIRVLYFAALKEKLGAEQWLDTSSMMAPIPHTVEQLWTWLCQQSSLHERVLGERQRLLSALNQTMCDDAAALEPGADGVCEVAFFPPVTGG